MAKLDFNYYWSARTVVYDGGYPFEDISGADAEEHTTNESEGEAYSTYYFTDTNYGFNAMKNAHPTWSDQQVGEYLNDRGSRCNINVRDKWIISRKANNVIHVDVTTTITKIWRDHIPADYGGNAYHRVIEVKINNETVWSGRDISIGAEQVYFEGEISRTQSFDIQPEADLKGVSSVYISNRNQEVASAYPDNIGAGVNFKNLLPKEFSHRLNYHLDGAIDGPANEEWTSKSQCENHQISNKTPNKPHWSFLGYSTNPSAATGDLWPGDTINVCEQVDLYAKWHYTYRPGMHRVNGVWKSCDRDGATGPVGFCNIRKGGKWVEMRIDGDNVGLADPPCIFDKGDWRIMKLIGDEGAPHTTPYNCPHQWN